jgi:PTS system N-acetylglucosamine-specific IIC component
MFLAPALYAVHALLTGIAFILTNALHVRLGFGFSAGLIDYVLNFRLATRPLWLLPLGAGYFALYYVLFRFVIVRFDLKTPGRDAGEAAAAPAPLAPAARAGAWIGALGGGGNLRSVDACTTRLRLTVKSQTLVDADALRQLGARGIVRPSPEALQVVVGTTADQLAGEIRAALQSGEPALARRTVTAQTPGAAWRGDAAALLVALGGRDNVRSLTAAASRVRLEIRDAARLDRTRLDALGLRGVAVLRPNCVHLLVGPEAGAAAVALRHLLEPTTA